MPRTIRTAQQTRTLHGLRANFARVSWTN